jgi:hypothetical protein
VPIVGLCSLSAPRNKSFLLPKVTLTTRSAASRAVRQESHSVMEMMATASDHSARCFPQCVPSVARIAKYLSNPAKADRSTAASVTLRSERTGNNS